MFERLTEIHRAVADSMGFDEVLRLIAEHAAELVAADLALVLLADSQGALVVRGLSARASPEWASLSVPREEAVTASLRGALELQEEDLVWAVPLVVDPGVHGMLAAVRRSRVRAGSRPSGREAELLEALAEASAIALLNAKLYDDMRSARQEAERRSEALVRLQEASVGLLILESDAPTHDRLIEILCHVTGAPRGVYWLLDEKSAGGPALLSKGTYGFRRVPRNDTDRRLQELMVRIDLSSPHPVARAARSMSLVALPDTRGEGAGDEIAAVWSKTGIRSVLAVPLRARGRVLGVVLLSWREAGRCSEEATLRTAEVMANQVAAALDTAALVEELSRASRLKDEFLATLSHELRNPLNVIVGYAEILSRHPEARASGGVSQAVDVIQRNAATQARLVSDLLDLSRLKTGKLALHLQLVELGSLVSEALAAVRPDAAYNRVELDLELPAEPLLAAVDPVRVRQILWNLLDNAVKFTPPGGTVTVRLTAEGEAARLSVEDTGKGIDAAFLSEVFEMFRQADAGLSRRHGGLGIGLALVRQLVELHSGSVSAESAGSGHGSRFNVWLPAQCRVLEVSPRSDGEPRGSLANVRVLVVDDSEDTTRMLAQLLTLEGAQVATADSGAQALALTDQSRFDVILSDISMPEMDGYELLQALRSRPRSQSIPAIAITGFGQEGDAERARAAGFAAHFTKPVEVAQLIEAARAALSS